MFLLSDRNNLGHFCKAIVFLDKVLCRLLNFVLIILFLVGFSNQKTLFLDILCFLSLLYNKKVCLLQCVVSNFYHRFHKLIVHVRRGTGIYRPFLYDLGVFHCLEKLESLTIFGLCLYLYLTLIVEACFYNLHDSDKKVFLYCFDRKIRNRVNFCFLLRLGNNVLFFSQNNAVN